MPKGYVVLVLHAHLPYVLSHGKWPHGSDWLCEAACETYIPLLNTLDRLSKEGKSAHFTIGITPILCEMLAAPLFKSELKAYIAEKVRAATHDRRSFTSDGRQGQADLARGWRVFYESRLKDFTDAYQEDLLGAFRRLEQEGQIEIIVSAATHAYLPLLGRDASISAQIAIGVETYRKHFLTDPVGMWLPECAYSPGKGPLDEEGRTGSPRKRLETFLAAHNLKYFFLDGCQLLQRQEPLGYGMEIARKLSLWESGVPSRQYDEGFGPRVESIPPPPEDRERRVWSEGQTPLYAIHKTGSPESGECAFFVRDTDTSLQVWSGQRGYPGDPAYLEFHKKHAPGGLRYWRVTDHEGDLGTKLPYEPDKAQARVLAHAAHFKKVIEERLDRYMRETGRTGVLTLPFDAELFGHWWFEGIDWLYALASAFSENCVKIERASAVLQSIGPVGAVSLPEGSWGEGGLHLTWDNKETAWTWECIHGAERSMAEAVAGEVDEAGARILRQMARELLLLQSSDWQFLITTGTAADYGKSRFLGHYKAFEALQHMYEGYKRTRVLEDSERDALRVLEERDAVFDNVNLEWFKERMGDGL
jgi:1,4-alpha-glucan branching enzyme